VASIPVVSSTAEATAMVRAGLEFLASADATQLAAEEQARCLHALEQASSISTAARTAGQGLDLRGLAELAAEMLARSRQDNAPDEETGQDEIFDDRALRLETTFEAPPGTKTAPRSCTATARPPEPGNTPGYLAVTAWRRPADRGRDLPGSSMPMRTYSPFSAIGLSHSG